MLGSYVKDQFRGMKVSTLGLKETNNFVCDLTKEIPSLGDIRFNTVIHCAGTEDDSIAAALNHGGTLNLLKGLEGKAPENFVYISSYKVYSRDAGENLDEETNTWASDETGKSKALTEKELKEWALSNNVTLTIIRPARMFGNGVSGETLRLFNDAVKGYYIHIRGNDSKLSLVTAFDVARGVKALYRHGGIFNAADGRNPRFIEMVESMTANAGAKKRMTHLPVAWAEWVWRLGRWIPSIQRNLSPEVVEKRMKTLTLDGSRFADIAGFVYYDTIKVMEGLDSGYPYTSRNNPLPETKHEV